MNQACVVGPDAGGIGCFADDDRSLGGSRGANGIEEGGRVGFFLVIDEAGFGTVILVDDDGCRLLRGQEVDEGGHVRSAAA